MLRREPLQERSVCFKTITGTSIWENNGNFVYLSGGSVYVYSITGTLSHFGAYTVIVLRYADASGYIRGINAC